MKLPEKLHEQYLAAFNRGYSYNEIARLLKISHRTACYWRVKLNLPKRKNLGGGYSRGV